MGTATALCVLTFVAGGCGGTEESTSTSASTAPEVAAPPTKSSGGVTADEGVPLPPGARSSQGAAYDYANAWQVPGSSFDKVVAFYDDQMPEGKDWQDWTWCDTGAAAGASPSRTYSRGSNEILSITLIEGKPPGILIGMDQSGPC